MLLYREDSPARPMWLLSQYRNCREKGLDVPKSVSQFFADFAVNMLEIDPYEQNKAPLIRNALSMKNYRAFRQFHEECIAAYVQVRVFEERRLRSYGDKDNHIYSLIHEELMKVGIGYDPDSLRKFAVKNPMLELVNDVLGMMLSGKRAKKGMREKNGKQVKREPLLSQDERKKFDTETGVVTIADFFNPT